MKRRIGFVSNSSSSSFIAFGARLSEEEVFAVRKFMIENGSYKEKLREAEDDDDEDESFDDAYEFLDEVTDNNFINCDGDFVVGYIIATGDECGDLSEGSMTLTEMMKNVNELTVKFGIPENKIKLIYGSYPC